MPVILAMQKADQEDYRFGVKARQGVLETPSQMEKNLRVLVHTFHTSSRRKLKIVGLRRREKPCPQTNHSKKG
jgi:hypothetical protein